MKLIPVALLLLALPAIATAQSAAALAPSRSTLFEIGSAGFPPDSASPAAYPRTHWREGAIAGGLLVGLVGAAMGEGLCRAGEGSGSCSGSLLLGALVGGLLGTTIGALIGGQFPK